LDTIRKDLLEDLSILTFEDYEDVSIHLKKSQRSTAAVTKQCISSKKISLLYQYFCYLTPALEVLELGTCTGINTQYLAAATKGKLFTLDSSKALVRKAGSYNSNPKIEYFCGRIQEKLPALLEQRGKLDFALVNATHTAGSTLDIFATILPYLHEKSILVIRDIHRSKGIENAWNEVRCHPKVTLSLDFFECGIIFFDKGYPQTNYVLEY
jgi:predicted O-methyltransferase YrrM